MMNSTKKTTSTPPPYTHKIVVFFTAKKNLLKNSNVYRVRASMYFLPTRPSFTYIVIPLTNHCKIIISHVSRLPHILTTVSPLFIHVQVCPMDKDICKIRLDFIEFDIAQPNNDALNPLPSARTQCVDAHFHAQSDGVSVPFICGTNMGYHSEYIRTRIWESIPAHACMCASSSMWTIDQLGHYILPSCLILSSLFGAQRGLQFHQLHLQGRRPQRLEDQGVTATLQGQEQA